MKKTALLTAAVFALLGPALVSADHLDVIHVDLEEECAFPTYLAIIADFNEWGEEFGYRTEIAMPIQSSHAETLLWIGRSKNAEAFGKAWDAWRDSLMDPSSVPAQLQARFEECSGPIEIRQGYDTY